MSQNDHQPDLTGPGSPLYQVLSDGVMLYTALPVLVFAVASEGGGQGVDDHDRVAGIHARGNVGLGDILDRLLNSADMVIGLVFAGDERPVVAHAIHELHRHIEGKLRDGSRYHAWNKDLWALTWAGILKPIMTVYEELRGFESKAFRQDVYTGLLQLGEGFRVRKTMTTSSSTGRTHGCLPCKITLRPPTLFWKWRNHRQDLCVRPGYQPQYGRP